MPPFGCSIRLLILLLLHLHLHSSNDINTIGRDRQPTASAFSNLSPTHFALYFLPEGQRRGGWHVARAMHNLMKCWMASGEVVCGESSRRRGKVDGLTWYKDLGDHANGQFSMAVVQANDVLEDHGYIESGPMGPDSTPGTFIGIYDGHGGPETARFVADRLLPHLKEQIWEHHGMSEDVIYKSYVSIEEEFMSLVQKLWLKKPQLAAVGACCLIGFLYDGWLYVANAGDSRAVLGTLNEDTKNIESLQLSAEHNANLESVREELKSLHPDDSDIVLQKNGVWRVKGIIQVSRSIGDAYLKSPKFNREPLLPKFRLQKPFKKPILQAEPSIKKHNLCSQDQFVIFASDGLWEHLSNDVAVTIVSNNPRNGIARRLLKTALKNAAKNREMRYSDLKKIDRGVRRHFHDDITIVVVFLDFSLVAKPRYRGANLSLRAANAPVIYDTFMRSESTDQINLQM